MPVKRQRWTRGDVVRIPLPDGSHSHAQMLDDGEHAFFDPRTYEDLSPVEIARSPVPFRLWVMRYAHSQGRWLKVGAAPIAEPLCSPVLRYNQDPMNVKDIRLTLDGCAGPVISFADCEGHECVAVWDPDHVEDRIRDHFAGVPNLWEVSLRPTNPA